MGGNSGIKRIWAAAGAHSFWLNQEPELQKFCLVSREVETLQDDCPELLNRSEKVFSEFSADKIGRQLFTEMDPVNMVGL